MKRLVPIVTILLALAGCGKSEPVQTAQVRLGAVPGRPAAGYFTLTIAGDRSALLSVRSPRAGRIEMHETMDAGNMTSMRPLARLPVRDGETLTFAPGGRHLMIYDLGPNIEAGSTLPLILNFERGSPVTLAAAVTAPGGDLEH